ncbi:homocysteine S-methyltransferase family protein [Vibrio neptunius]|uniref:homocysteine S-methyltransferase family protein n=1 Tax=Vibrio neptunius TaxID=170651 RepID=UPI000A7B05E0|nr:homocysteine S-methyltransferase family protein [Vibrio neptunius]
MKEIFTCIDVFSQTDKPCFVAFTLMDEVNQPARLRSGESVSSAVELLLSNEARGIFFNCSIPEVIEQAIKAVNNVVDLLDHKLAIGVFANSFTPINTSHEANNTVQAMRHFSPREYLEFAKTWHSLGASIIGGCCGIEPSHIEVLSAWRDGMEES